MKVAHKILDPEGGRSDRGVVGPSARIRLSMRRSFETLIASLSMLTAPRSPLTMAMTMLYSSSGRVSSYRAGNVGDLVSMSELRGVLVQGDISGAETLVYHYRYINVSAVRGHSPSTQIKCAMSN